MSNRRFCRYALAAALAGAAHGLLYAPLVSSHETYDTPEYTALGHELLHGSYSSTLGSVKGLVAQDRPSAADTVDVTGLSWPRKVLAVEQADVYRTPGFPLLLAAVGGGTGDASRLALFVIQALLMGGEVLLAAVIARRLWGPGIGLAAAAVFALDPYSKRYVSIVLTETLTGFCVLLSAYAVVRAWQARSAAWWGAAGGLCAATALVRPLYALSVPLAVMAALLTNGSWTRRAGRALACLGCAAVLLGPWIGRNAAVSGRPTLAGFGAGWSLLLGAHGEGLGHTGVEVIADASFIRDFASVHAFAPTVSQLRSSSNAYARYLVAADAQQRTLARRLYFKRLESDPGGVLWEVAYRSYFLWMAHEDWYQPSNFVLQFLRLVDWALLALTATGIVLALRRGGPGRGLAIFLVLFTLISALGHVEARYTVPLRGLYLAFAVWGAARIFASGRARAARLRHKPHAREGEPETAHRERRAVDLG